MNYYLGEGDEGWIVIFFSCFLRTGLTVLAQAAGKLMVISHRLLGLEAKDACPVPVIPSNMNRS